MSKWILSGVLGVLCLAAPLTAQTARVAEAGSDNGFVVLYSVNVERPQKTGAATEGLLRFGLYLENTSRYPVSSVSVSAYVYDEHDRLSGFHSLVIDEEIPPNRKIYHLHMTGDVRTRPGDDIVLRIEEIDGPGGRIWELPTKELELLDPYAVLPYLEWTGSPLSYKVGSCIAFCEKMAGICGSLCAGTGVENFSCAQGADGTCNGSCRCYRNIPK